MVSLFRKTARRGHFFPEVLGFFLELFVLKRLYNVCNLLGGQKREVFVYVFLLLLKICLCFLTNSKDFFNLFYQF